MFLLWVTFICVLCVLFMHTGIESISRQIQHNRLNEAMNIVLDEATSLDDAINTLIYENEYIHSIWLVSNERNEIFLPDSIINIPDAFMTTFNKSEGDSWHDPFRYGDVILVPYVKKVNTNSVIIMFPFYL